NTVFSEAGGVDCTWNHDVGAWKCKWCRNETELPGKEEWNCNVAGNPLGPLNATYFQSNGHMNKSAQEWDGPFANGHRALKGHYWICGQHTYKILPANWTGICYVGVIYPLFFLLPGNGDKNLSVKLYDNLVQSKQSVNTAVAGESSQTWGKDNWPPQRIIQHYGPATWNPDEVISSAREPVYNLNCIIRLQAILEIITNETARALDLLANQATQMRTAILQHRMVLDYLLAAEGGVCGKLNDLNCCLKIDDNGQVVKHITSGIRKLAHVPVQTWKGWEFAPFSWLPGAPWVKRVLFYLLCGVTMLLVLPCIIPCL
ncbi:ENR1 protein, partial [Fregata magnificens]|nr:ENR1 protein [Fregata magnificens]